MIDANPITAPILTDDACYTYTGPGDAWEVDRGGETTTMSADQVCDEVGALAVERALEHVTDHAAWPSHSRRADGLVPHLMDPWCPGAVSAALRGRMRAAGIVIRGSGRVVVP